MLTLLGDVAHAKEKHVGCYYGVWSYTRPGIGEFWPEDIDVSLCDVIYYGFGNVLNDTFEVCSWDPWFDLGDPEFSDTTIKNCIQERDGDPWPVGCVTDAGLKYCHYDGIRRTIALKEKNPNLKVLFSVGGWTAGGWIFSQMAQTHDTRNKFIKSVIHFLGYFGFDGLDLDWEFPALDMLPDPVQPTDPDDKIHFTALMKELRHVFDVADPPYLLTIAAAQDPAKAENAYEAEKIHEYIDWFNVMSYDYGGAWDGFTGIDQPLYGRWGEGFVGHPHYQFNIHESMQYWLSKGVPAEKLSLGIHTEGKGFLLDDPSRETSGVYCPASQPSPNMTFSRQEGWLNYYEVLQFFYNETIEDPLWSDLEPGIENWNVYDHEHGNVDGCYLSPFAYQGKYWVSYDDENSVDVKARYANHYGLKGAFIWEVDTDNFMGMYGKEKFTILAAVSRAIESGEGLRDGEILGNANDNTDCSPTFPMCDPNFNFTTPIIPTTTAHTSAPECSNGNDCNEDNSVICNADYDNCFYCNGHLCKPGKYSPQVSKKSFISHFRL